MNTRTSKQGSPELWLTPLIGLCLLGPLIWHWRMRLLIGPFARGWHAELKANILLDILIGLAPLLVTAGVQRLLRIPKWPTWAQGLSVGVLGAVIVGTFYYYALYPLANWALASDESWGNDLIMYADDAFSLGIAAGFGVFASAFAINALVRRRALTAD
ncbi:hypothetical protein [Asticcacaulis solisilvae]|uniref:hypothetical protein n=1 Tax=Asticcacaulis solisilvae TaxID=1217274 RepID=UPI003FD8BAE6